MADSATALEQRVDELEKRVADVLVRLRSSTPEKDWRSTLGVFSNDSVMKEIDEEGRKIRAAEREEARRDHS